MFSFLFVFSFFFALFVWAELSIVVQIVCVMMHNGARKGASDMDIVPPPMRLVSLTKEEERKKVKNSEPRKPLTIARHYSIPNRNT